MDGIHRPAALLHLGPGGGGSTLPPPGTVIDFAETRYVNEPWATRTELRDATNALVIAAVDLSPYATWHGLDGAAAAVRADVETRVSGAVSDIAGRIDALCARDEAILLEVAAGDDRVRADLNGRVQDAAAALSSQIGGVYHQTISDNLALESAIGARIGDLAALDTVRSGQIDALAARDDAINARVDILAARVPWLSRLPASLTLPPGAMPPEYPLLFGVASDGISPATVRDANDAICALLSITNGLAVVASDYTGAPELASGTVVAVRVAYMDEAGNELAAIRAAADEIVLPEDPTAAELGAAFRDLLMCIKNPQRARAAIRAARGTPR